MTDPVARLADRVTIDPAFLAFALAEYAAANGLDDAALAAALGTTPDRLPHVRLCPAPRADPAGFREDVDRVAATFGLDRTALATAARVGQAVAALRATDPAPAADGTLLAARDRPAP